MKSFLVALAVFVGHWLTRLFVTIAGPFLGPPPENANGASLDADLAGLLTFSGLFTVKDLLEKDFEGGRRRVSFGMRVTGVVGPGGVDVEDRTIEAGSHPIPIRLYDPRPSRKLPGCLFYHGGGFVVGDLDSHDGFCRLLAAVAEVRVASVDYRLAPEHRFPAAVNDAVTSYRWFRKHAKDLNVDPARISVAGDSAGATLATVVCQHEIEEEQAPPDSELLLYPPTDSADDYESQHGDAENILLSREAVEWFGEQYIGNQEVDPVNDYRISPLRYDRLEEMPPTVVATAGFDPLRDEGIAYVRELRRNDVEVLHRHYEELVHGFVTFGGISTRARNALLELVNLLRSVQTASGGRTGTLEGGTCLLKN